MLVLGLLMLYYHDTLGAQQWLTQTTVLYPLVLVLSYLLLAEIPMFSFKFKHLRWEGNQLRFIFALLALAMLALWQTVALAPIVVLYVVLNVARKVV